MRAVVSAANRGRTRENIRSATASLWCQKPRNFFEQMSWIYSKFSVADDSTMRLNGTTTVSVDFQVRGELQGLYFLKHCKEEATTLGVCGWVKRDSRGAIIGVIQGQRSRIEQMICWLSCRGSPGSRIDECCLDNYRYISWPEYRSFSVRY